ncbi:MAG: class I SAM-dependent methyltransferase [Chlamydiales bacterium]
MLNSRPYKALCTEFYDLDKPTAPKDALQFYLQYAAEANGHILEPMCGTGRFLIPLLENGYSVTGFDSSSHMLNVCRKKCKERNLIADLVEATFEAFSLPQRYNLIFIPSGSFGLLTDLDDVNKALQFISDRLESKGKFVFEIETVKAVDTAQGVWKGSWVNQSEGSLIVLNTLSRFDSSSRIHTTLCRYELWKENAISRVEVEDFRLRLYEMSEMDELLAQYGFIIAHKWAAEPYLRKPATEATEVVIYECVKN